MNVRNARIRDAEEIRGLITYYAELDRMLFCSLADIYENMQRFKVAEIDGTVVGCCALQVVWCELGEVKSLAVAKDFAGKGVGRELVSAALQTGKELGLAQMFTLTLEPEFFKKLGFKRVEKDTLPMKVWSDCARCSKQDHCDEVAMVYELLS